MHTSASYPGLDSAIDIAARASVTLAATNAQLASPVTKTAPEILQRYRANCNHRYFPKEWIYRNVNIEGKDVLDFGCGNGEITTQLALLGARKVYGLDVTPGLIEATRRRAEYDGVSDQIELISGLVQEVQPRQVDVLIAFAVLHHCFPLENVMPHLMRWLKPGGTFVAVEPVVHLGIVEWLRNRSGVRGDPLDEGERKLNPHDLRYVLNQLSEPAVIPFNLVGRLTRVYPGMDLSLRRIDQELFRVPLLGKLAGTALIIGRKPQSRLRGRTSVGDGLTSAIAWPAGARSNADDRKHLHAAMPGDGG